MEVKKVVCDCGNEIDFVKFGDIITKVRQVDDVVEVEEFRIERYNKVICLKCNKEIEIKDYFIENEIK